MLKKILIITLLVLGSFSLYFSPQIKSFLTSAINFSLSITAPPNQQNQQVQVVENRSSSRTPKTNSTLILSGNGCPNGQIALRINNTNSKTQKTPKSGEFSMTKTLKPNEYDLEISCKNENGKLIKKISYEDVKLTKNETKKISNINLKAEVATIKKAAIATKSGKPRLIKKTIKNF